MKLLKLLAVTVCVCGFAACSSLTGADGSPVGLSPVCVETENGRVCYLPNAPVPPAPIQTLEK